MITSIPSYITHYYERSKGPLLNITGLPLAEAEELMTQIRKGDAFNSKRDQHYIENRIRHEQKLKKEFIRMGGQPKRGDPFYFVLGSCTWMSEWYQDTAQIQLDWKSIPSESISFSYPDSMISFEIAGRADLQKYRRSYHGKLFGKDEIEEVVSTYGMPGAHWRNDETYFFDRYIEVQVWDETPLLPYLRPQ